MKRVSMLAMAALPALVGGVAAPALPAAGAILPRSHRPPRVHPDSDAVCAYETFSLRDCTFVHGAGVDVSGVGIYNWSKGGTGYVGYASPGGMANSKWRAKAMVYNSSKLYHYSWAGIHCSFPARTHIYGWTNYDVIRKPYVEIVGTSFNDIHACVPVAH
jgi:hypothetical protein